MLPSPSCAPLPYHFQLYVISFSSLRFLAFVSDSCSSRVTTDFGNLPQLTHLYSEALFPNRYLDFYFGHSLAFLRCPKDLGLSTRFRGAKAITCIINLEAVSYHRNSMNLDRQLYRSCIFLTTLSMVTNMVYSCYAYK